MEDKKDLEGTSKKQGWFGKLLEKLDKKMEAKARQTCCCSKENAEKGSRCC